MNRELRRLQEKEEKRAKDRRAKGQQRPRRQRVGWRQFFREVRQELRRVSWPSRDELVTFTAVVVITTTVLTGIVFVMDFVFKQAVLLVLGRL